MPAPGVQNQSMRFLLMGLLAFISSFGKFDRRVFTQRKHAGFTVEFRPIAPCLFAIGFHFARLNYDISCKFMIILNFMLFFLIRTHFRESTALGSKVFTFLTETGTKNLCFGDVLPAN